MKKRIITYWVTTVLVVIVMGVSGALAIAHSPAYMKALAHLGYPAYFSNLLGIGKLIGVCVLLAPGSPRLKEWAYPVFGITVISACYSHFNAGDGWVMLDPLVTLVLLCVSYLTRPASRMFPNPESVRTFD